MPCSAPRAAEMLSGKSLSDDARASLAWLKNKEKGKKKKGKGKEREKSFDIMSFCFFCFASWVAIRSPGRLTSQNPR
jgi:hypothetical protein